MLNGEEARLILEAERELNRIQHAKMGATVKAAVHNALVLINRALSWQDLEPSKGCTDD